MVWGIPDFIRNLLSLDCILNGLNLHVEKSTLDTYYFGVYLNTLEVIGREICFTSDNTFCELNLDKFT